LALQISVAGAAASIGFHPRQRSLVLLPQPQAPYSRQVQWSRQAQLAGLQRAKFSSSWAPSPLTALLYLQALAVRQLAVL
jgi:hypothetical protein